MHEYRYKANKNYVLLDVNTSGIKDYDRILEICMMKVENNEVVDTFQRFVNPNYNFFNRKWTKWQEYENLSHLPTIFDLKKEILAFIGRKNIVGWCVDFDIEHLERDLGGIMLNNNFVDVHDCYRTFIKTHCYGSLRNTYAAYYKYRGDNKGKDYNFDDVYDKCMATMQMYEDKMDLNRFVYKELPSADYLEFPDGDILWLKGEKRGKYEKSEC